ncbi:hypothetical protein [Corynebacterium sp. H113]|uniref:hypothetical protein n=1 Tax=Corynebacterium sp. H113 TaxID=3133419 RepID=UPI0030A2D528
MSLSDAPIYYDLGLFLAINEAERKRLTLAEYRCAARGCYLASLIKFRGGTALLGRLQLKGVAGLYDDATTFAPGLDSRLASMSVDEFILEHERLDRGELAAVYLAQGGSNRSVYKVFTPEELRTGDALVKCGHLGGSLNEMHLSPARSVVRLSASDIS